MTKDNGSWISKLKDVMGVTYNKVADSFNNPSLRYGPQSNAIGGQTWSNERLSNQWQMLRVMYRTNSLARRIVDVAAKDMTREPLIFTGSCDPAKLDELQQQWARLQISKKMGFGLSMARLFGGAIVYIDVAWQDSADELDISTIAKGQFLGLKVYHRWQLSPSIEVDAITECPIYYDVTSGESTYTTDREDNQLIKRIHASRCIKLDGDNLEYYDWIENLRWGASIFEQGYDRLLYLNTGIASIAGILTKASQQVYKVNDLQSVIASGDNGKAETPLDRAISLMSKYRNTENMMVIDAMDAMEIHSYQLSGVDAVVNQLRLEICTAYRYPVTKIYLDSPSGLNATGENDTRMYYDEIKAAQEENLREGYNFLTKIMYQSTFGKPPAADFNFKFAPLWQMSAKEKSEIAINNVNAINIAFSAGIISQEVALKELRQMADATDLFTNITDEDLENSETSDPPSPEDLAGEMSLNAKKAEAGNEKEDIKDEEEDDKDSDKKAIEEIEDDGEDA